MIEKMCLFLKTRTQRGPCDEGSAILELAISLPLLLLMLLGMAELARVAYAAIEVSSAAHAAAQFAASSHAYASNYTQSGSTYGGGMANAVAANSDLGGTNAISITNVALSCVCENTAYTPSSCSDNTTCESKNTAMIETVTVQTQTSFHPLIHYPGGAYTYTLYGSDSETVSNQ